MPETIQSALAGLRMATTPLVSPQAARRGANLIEGVEAAPTEGGFFDALGAIPDVARNLVREPVATLRGALGGAVEGLGTMTDPVSVATTIPTGGLGRLGGQAVKAGVRAVDAAEPALAGLARAAQPARSFSLQGALDDILAGGGAALDDVAEVGAKSGPTAMNASGESAASLEALGRRAWETQTGRKLVRVDRAGRETPFIGEPGDIRLNPGDRVGYRHTGGRFEELSRGGR